MNKLMRWGTLAVAALGLLSAPGGRVEAQIINGGFETGDLTGWTPNPAGLVSVVNSYQSYGPVFTPVEGNYFAVLSAGAGTNTYTTLSQTFTATAGQTLSGNAFFQANDYIPFNDDGYVKIIENGQVLFTSNVAAVGNYGNTPWTPFSYTFTSGGSYTIQAGVENTLDNSLSSVLGLDNVKLGVSAVPEPATIITSGLACLVGLGYASRRRKAKTNA